MNLNSREVILMSSRNSETDGHVLAVDLDGTLLLSDMLHETFWSALSLDWKAALYSVAAIFRGRSTLKRTLAERSDVDPSLLPYDKQVISIVEDWRRNGGRTALVTASDQGLAEAISEHLGIFDEVHGTNRTRNLKGKIKAKFLAESYGRYSYVGDSIADMPVWAGAYKAIVKSNSASLINKVRNIHENVTIIEGKSNSNWALLNALRPHQWAKNGLVFVAMFAAHRVDPEILSRGLLAFVAFSLIASSVYLLNDLLDLSADRAHPRKFRRPFASGAANLQKALPVIVVFLAIGAAFGALLGPHFLLVLLTYYLVTLAYSMKLKRYPILDICVLAALYTLRIVAGAVATGVPLSVWLFAFSLFFFFSLAAIKRQAELIDALNSDKIEIQGRGYRPLDVNIISQFAIASGMTSVLVLALYVNSNTVSELYKTPEALWILTLIVLYWICRVSFITQRGEMHDDPVVFAMRDKVSLLCGVAMFSAALLATYG